MSIYEITSDQIKKLDETTFGKQGIKERDDLQRLLLKNIDVISPETFVLDEEFSDWHDSKRRIDILALDKDANLVVIELKRTEDGGYMELQAIRYAAMVSTLTFERTVEIHDSYLKKHGHDSDAETEILKFLGWEEPDDESFAQNVSIVLASADFSKELTTSVMWLNKQNIYIKCIRIKPYSKDGRTFVEVQQVIPLPEAEDYLIKVREQEQQERSPIIKEKFILRTRFWEGLLSYAKTKTKLHETRPATRRSYIHASSGFRGIRFKYEIVQNEARVTLYIDRKNAEENRDIFNTFRDHKDEIEKNFGHTLNWREVEKNRSCTIFFTIFNGGYRSDEDKWTEIYNEMVEAMISLEKAFRPHIDKLKD
jgi:hypothetical protein